MMKNLSRTSTLTRWTSGLCPGYLQDYVIGVIICQKHDDLILESLRSGDSKLRNRVIGIVFTEYHLIEQW